MWIFDDSNLCLDVKKDFKKEKAIKINGLGVESNQDKTQKN